MSVSRLSGGRLEPTGFEQPRDRLTNFLTLYRNGELLLQQAGHFPPPQKFSPLPEGKSRRKIIQMLDQSTFELAVIVFASGECGIFVFDSPIFLAQGSSLHASADLSASGRQMRYLKTDFSFFDRGAWIVTFWRGTLPNRREFQKKNPR